MDTSKKHIESTFGATLTPREYEVVSLVLSGTSTNDIAVSLGLSKQTVQTYLKRVYKTCRVHSREELTAKVFGTWAAT